MSVSTKLAGALQATLRSPVKSGTEKVVVAQAERKLSMAADRLELTLSGQTDPLGKALQTLSKEAGALRKTVGIMIDNADSMHFWRKHIGMTYEQAVQTFGPKPLPRLFEAKLSSSETYDQALNVAVKANFLYANGEPSLLNVAEKAFLQAGSKSLTSGQALKVANEAYAQGYTQAAGKVFVEAARLSSNPVSAFRIGRLAGDWGYPKNSTPKDILAISKNR